MPLFKHGDKVRVENFLLPEYGAEGPVLSIDSSKIPTCYFILDTATRKQMWIEENDLSCVQAATSAPPTPAPTPTGHPMKLPPSNNIVTVPGGLTLRSPWVNLDDPIPEQKKTCKCGHVTKKLPTHEGWCDIGWL